jgi:hypothetical protein
LSKKLEAKGILQVEWSTSIDALGACKNESWDASFDEFSTESTIMFPGKVVLLTTPEQR